SHRREARGPEGQARRLAGLAPGEELPEQVEGDADQPAEQEHGAHVAGLILEREDEHDAEDQREHPGPHDPGLVPDVALWLLLLTHASYLTTQLNVPEEVRWLANVASLFAFGRRSRISSARWVQPAAR